MKQAQAKTINQQTESNLKWIPIQSCRLHSAAQLEGGLGSKTRLVTGEQGCTLFTNDTNWAVKVVLPKYNDQIIVTAHNITFV